MPVFHCTSTLSQNKLTGSTLNLDLLLKAFLFGRFSFTYRQISLLYNNVNFFSLLLGIEIHCTVMCLFNHKCISS